MNNIIYKEESFKIIGLCFEVHNYLGPGFLEVVYKDALEYEFRKDLEWIVYKPSWSKDNNPEHQKHYDCNSLMASSMTERQVR